MAEKIEEPKGKALEDLIRQRDDQRAAAAAKKAYDKAIVYPETVKPDDKKAKGGSVKSSASKRADGIASRGKTKGRMI
jgi:hypothetical protein